MSNIMIQNIAQIIVLLSALFLFILACLSLFIPRHAVRFLGGFASSAKAHYLEMILRLIVGAAFVINAPFMLHTKVFMIFGWLLVGSTVILVLLPWRWHQLFGQIIASPVIGKTWLIGIGSLLLSVVIFFAALKNTNHEPFIGKWNLENVSYKAKHGLCERIVMTTNNFVCDGKSTEVEFKKLGRVWQVTSTNSVDAYWLFEMSDRNHIAIKLKNGELVEYGRVEP
jgi:hypothetical protein